MLDPRAGFYFFTKYESYEGHESVAAVAVSVRSELAPYIKAAQEGKESACQVPPEHVDDLFGDPILIRASVDELRMYKGEVQVGPKEHPLLKWKLYHSKYPVLASAARDFLGARATSAPSERVFSTGWQLVSEFCRALTPDTIRKCTLLKSWIGVLRA